MDCREKYFARKEQFNKRVKYDMLNELNEKCSAYGKWSYDDGHFYLDLPEKEAVFILSGDFEPYVFDRLARLSQADYTVEQSVSSIDETFNIVEDFFYTKNED